MGVGVTSSISHSDRSEFALEISYLSPLRHTVGLPQRFNGRVVDEIVDASLRLDDQFRLPQRHTNHTRKAAKSIPAKHARLMPDECSFGEEIEFRCESRALSVGSATLTPFA